ncbi:MAG TPA: hypothetical protein PKD24_09590 [Pyrinomonadaceae bacterium]|nr:hypothetical protein [Pyrinomonadaceae bacterium]HMP65679.1 hypothetical protein [Pyrinomonadaceae bacterium]
MTSSRIGTIVSILLAVFVTTNCAYYNKIVSRKNLVDGAEAYKGRKFDEAEDFFRRAAARDPEGLTMEGRTAQLFLARTIHSKYIGNRRETDLAESAIEEYKKVLQLDPNEQSAYKAVAGLFENLQKQDDWMTWVTNRANNTEILPQHRAEAFTSLAVRQHTCANEISDTDATKKPGKRDGKDIFIYVKPEKPEDLERMRGCVTQGMQLIQQAIDLETEEIKNIKGVNPKELSDTELRQKLDLVKAFESARSYRTALLMQSSRLAEMDGREAEAEQLRKQVDEARAKGQELSEVNRQLQAEIDARIAAAIEAEKAADEQKPGGN